MAAPTPFIPTDPYLEERALHRAHVRAFYAALIMLFVCVLVLAAHV